MKARKIVVKQWIADKIAAEMHKFHIAPIYDEDREVGEFYVDEFGNVQLELNGAAEIIETEKAYKVELRTQGHVSMNERSKTWTAWIPKSQAITFVEK